jgi:hypothetical protein
MKYQKESFEAASILIGAVSEFPGLLNNSDEVSGADLVQFLSDAIRYTGKDFETFLKKCID